MPDSVFDRSTYNVSVQYIVIVETLPMAYTYARAKVLAYYVYVYYMTFWRQLDVIHSIHSHDFSNMGVAIYELN